jgi:hypothetical protein
MVEIIIGFFGFLIAIVLMSVGVLAGKRGITDGCGHSCEIPGVEPLCGGSCRDSSSKGTLPRK